MTPRPTRRFFAPALALCAMLATPAGAAAILVTSPADAGPGSLRQAVAEALPGDTVEFAPSVSRVTLAGAEILVDKDLEILGRPAGRPADQIVVDGGGGSRLFRVSRTVAGDMPVVLFSDLAMTGGKVRGGDGGAILNEGHLTLRRCSLFGNAAHAEPTGGNGGAIYNSGALRIEASVLHGNRAVGSGAPDTGNGGAICNAWGGTHPVVPRVALANATLSGNEALPQEGQVAHGGGLPESVRVLVDRCGLGGGLFNDTRPTHGAWGVDAVPGLVEGVHCTLAFNRAASGGGAANYLLMEGGSEGPGEALGGGAVYRTSIVSANAATADGGAHDLLGDALAYDSVVFSATGNLGGERNAVGRDAGLLPLGDNGGPTLTHALRPWSPAVNAASVPSDLLLDQTGAPRSLAGKADSGAWEFPAHPLPLGGGAVASFRDRDGDAVQIALTGPGSGYAVAVDGADAVDIVLEGTTGTSALRVDTTGQTSVRSISAEGRLGKLLAPNADLTGDVTVARGVKTLVLRDVLGPSVLRIGSVPGKVSALRFRRVRDCTLICEGKLRKVTAEEWVGDGDGAHDRLQAKEIGKLLVDGWLSKVRVLSEGDIEEVSVGGFYRSAVHAGVTPGLMGLPDPRTDLPARAKLTSFTVTGTAVDEGGHGFIDGIVAAWVIGRASLGSVRTSEVGPAFGLSARRINRLRYIRDGEEMRLSDLTGFGHSVREGRFAVSLDSTQDLGFTFGAMDDSRGDLWLPGVAVQTLGFLFQRAAEDHCRFMLVPGDLAAGYMGLCMSDDACALFDPDGSISKVLSDHQYPEFLRLAASYGYSPVGEGGVAPNLFPTRGNHEAYLKGSLTRDQWTAYIGQYLPQNGPSLGAGPDQNPEMDERGFTYAFRVDSSLFLGIDEYATLEDKDHGFAPPPDTRVPSFFCGGWLSDQVGAFLADPSLDHCFVFGHSPLYEVKMDTSMDATALTAAGRDRFLQDAGSSVDIYFCGHEHFYDHTVISGTTHPGGEGIDALHQVLVGTGGAEIDRVTGEDCDYSPSYIRDPERQYYHSPEAPSSGQPEPYIGYNLVTVAGPGVTFQWKAWHVSNPCHLPLLPVPCTLCPLCSVDATPVVTNGWDYSVRRGG